MLRFRILPSFRTIKRNYAFEKYAAKYSYSQLLKQKFNNLSPSAFSLLILPATAFGLGVWQIFRLERKKKLIKRIKDRTKAEPIPLPTDLRELENLEYTPVKLVGEFVHDQEFVIKPKQRVDDNVPKILTGTHYADKGVPNGGLVVTPFKPTGRDYTVLVARGWVPLSQCSKEARLDSLDKVQGQVEIIGITRNSEKRPSFVMDCKPERNFYPYRDVLTMAKYHNTAPAYFEVIYENSVPDGPIGGQTLINIRNQHFVYILTWFGVSGSMTYLWWTKFLSIKRRIF